MGGCVFQLQNRELRTGLGGRERRGESWELRHSSWREGELGAETQFLALPLLGALGEGTTSPEMGWSSDQSQFGLGPKNQTGC